MNISLRKKMLGMGGVVILAFGTLLGLMTYSGHVVETAMRKERAAISQSALRKDQRQQADRFEHNAVQLTLAAMEAVIDKESGTIRDPLMEKINARAAYLQTHFTEIQALAETDQERAALARLEATLGKFITTIRVDLKKLIESSTWRSQEITAAFVLMDDNLDIKGETLQEMLTAVESSFRERNEVRGADLTRRMLNAHLRIMLAANDAIIDRNDGQMDSERLDTIKTAAAFQRTTIDIVAGLAAAGLEKKLTAKIKRALPDLIGSIEGELKNLVEKGALENKQIAAEFKKMGAAINTQADHIEKILQAFKRSGAQKVTAAAEQARAVEAQLGADMEKHAMIQWSFALGVVALIGVIFYFFARGITRPINRIVSRLSRGTDQVNASAQQVSASSQTLAEGASEQAAAIEETSASLEEMSAMTRQNADNAGQADNLMKDAGRVIATANDAMQHLTASMQDISEASDEISKIIKTIDEIAFQTNLLALNAAVEAARAGEAGAGFAVVADEVRNLALRAADAAGNTAGLIEGTVAKIGEGSTLVNTTGDAFTEVAESAGRVGELVGDIAAASREQAQGIDQVSNAVNEMDKVVRQNAASAEESALASEEMKSECTQTSEIVDGLRQLIWGKTTSGEGCAAPAEDGDRSRTVRPSVESRDPAELVPLDEADFKDF